MEAMQSLDTLRWLQSIAGLVLFGGLAAMVLLEVLVPRDASVRSLRRVLHGTHNLILWICGIAVLSAVFGGTIWLMLQWFQFRRIGVLYMLPLPPLLHAVIAFALLDASDYVFHRLSHNVRWLWLLHAVHHSDENLDVTTNLRQHPLHVVPTVLWSVVASAAIGVPAWVFLVHEIASIAFAHLHHAAIRWPRWIDRTLSWLFVTPRMHWTHHSPEEAQTNSNYGVILSVWDRWFGSIAAAADEPRFGLKALADTRWHSAWGMLLTPWRARSIGRL